MLHEEEEVVFAYRSYLHGEEEVVFTFVLVAEVTEVSGASYRDDLSNCGCRPTGDDIPHARATCQEETRHQDKETHCVSPSFSTSD